jgi:hypothetical protein
MFASSFNAGLPADLLPKARETEIVSPLALAAGADAEATRQMIFLGGPLAEDTHLVPGQRGDLLGKPVTLQADQLGYEAGAVGFVIAFDETAVPGMTVLNVLRKLP